MIPKLGKFLKKTWKWWFLLSFFVLIIDFSPLIPDKPKLEGTQANIARGKVKILANRLASTDTTINLSFSGEEVVAISATLSHMFDNTQMGLGFSQTLVQGASSTEVNFGLFKIYLNLYCEISLARVNSQIEQCKLGDLPIPGIVVEVLLYSGISIMFDSEVANTIENLISNVSIKNRSLHINAEKSIDFKERINDTLDDAKSLAKLAIQTNIPDASLINVYLDDIARQAKHSDLAMYIRNSMQLASLRSIENNPIIENKAALWALAISTGTSKFARLAGVENYPTNHQVTLRGRRDLAQHFIYSAIIAQLSSTSFSANAGELKEILDSGKGGSGFSFADLLADNTGIAFSEALTKNEQSALLSQNLLSSMTQNDIFFPYVHDLPEGLSENKFRFIFDQSNADAYQDFLNRINARISALVLYSVPYSNIPTNANYLDIPKPRVRFSSSGRWLKVDTHIHSKYSDGAHHIKDIAQQAKRFGCDAIAITDHGDKNLSGVLSDSYFDDIQSANIDNTGLTVIPGLEWNLPPFNGREHATVLLPSHPNIKLQLRQFRSSYDHYNEFTRRHLTIEQGLEWLNNLDQQSPVSPVVIYNHPSRKDFETSENKYDMSEWQKLSATVIGMSGAPGHQKKRGDNNGSYETKLKTKHGLDPVSAIGSEWDLLLQKGYRVLAARSASDFHHTGMDYWPCQFSSTHVFSLGNQHNDILQALTNGRTWAQQGQFIERLNFMLLKEGQAIFAGQSLQANQLNKIRLNVDITLAKNDWQGFSAKLDELKLVVITSEKIFDIDLMPSAQINDRKINIDKSMSLPANTRAIRLLGRSIQPELHHYSVMTNPILVEQLRF